MPESVDIRTYEKLKNTALKRERYQWMSRTAARIVLVIMLVFFVFIPLTSFLGLEPLRINVYFPLFIVIIILTISSWAFDQLANKHRLSVDELTFVYANLTLENLDDYFASKKSKFPERKAKCRTEASKNARKLLAVIDNRWTVGDFELGHQILGGTLSKFKENLRSRLIPNIKEGDPDTILREARDIVNDFVAFLRAYPSIKNLEILTQRMEERLGEIPIKEKSRFSDFSAFLVGHSLIKHSLYISGITVLAFFVGLLGIYFNVSTDGAFITAVGLWGILIVGYFFESRRGKETKD